MQWFDRHLEILADLINKAEAIGSLMSDNSPQHRFPQTESMSADELPRSAASITKQYYTKLPTGGFDIVYVK